VLIHGKPLSAEKRFLVIGKEPGSGHLFSDKVKTDPLRYVIVPCPNWEAVMASPLTSDGLKSGLFSYRPSLRAVEHRNRRANWTYHSIFHDIEEDAVGSMSADSFR
jgi:hypothetical protein